LGRGTIIGEEYFNNGRLPGLGTPEASHLDLLSAFLSPEKIRATYDEAITRKYLWHEFGDLNLIL